jgi:hypothetical protein
VAGGDGATPAVWATGRPARAGPWPAVWATGRLARAGPRPAASGAAGQWAVGQRRAERKWSARENETARGAGSVLKHLISDGY